MASRARCWQHIVEDRTSTRKEASTLGYNMSTLRRDEEAVIYLKTKAP
jgi:hypothetical protein